METKRCFRLFCQGSMEKKTGVGYENRYENGYENWECSTCHSGYCRLCEKNWTSTHQCKKEDIASIEWKKSMQHCPHCSLPIEKVDGCDAITCAGCQKNFNYSTGLPCESGNHGKTIPISLPKESVKEVWKVLLNGRSKKDKQFTLKEKQMMKMLEEIEFGIEKYNISSFSKPTWEWSIYDIPSVQQWLSSLSTNSSNVTPSIDPQQEENVAKLVASRVDKLETRRQHIHHILKTLRSIEDELQSSIQTDL
jgi:transposase-like protein